MGEREPRLLEEGEEVTVARKIFGPASDFYRARLTRLDVPEPPLLEWRPDVLYRAAETSSTHEEPSTTFAVELVNLDSDRSFVLLSQPCEQEAQEALRQVLDDLATQSKGEFDVKYHVIPPVA